MTRKFAISLVVCLMMPVLPRAALSWGGEGHRTVGAVADILIQQHPRTRDRVKQLLNGRSLSEVSVFADCAKGPRYCGRDPSDEEKAYVSRNPDHHDYHYTNVPIQQTAYVESTAGTDDDDVVQVIRYAIKVLQGHPPAEGAANLTEPEALWVLVHLVGDVHQPLHVADQYYDQTCHKIVDPNVAGAGLKNFGVGGRFVGTTGGNDLLLSASEENNLHHFWDDTAVAGAMTLNHIRNKSIEDFAQSIVAHPPTGWQTTDDIDTWPTAWATQSLGLAGDDYTEADVGEASPKQSHTGTTCTASVSLDGDYKKKAKQVALDQLGRAGFRLNALLVKIFEGGNN
jgi:hypothetical protein